MDFPNARFTVLSKQIRKNNQLLNPHTCSASLKPAIVHDGTVVFEIESTVIKRNFNVSSLKDEQKESAVHLLQLKDVVKILPTKFEESLMYQLYTAKEMQMVLFFSISFSMCKCYCSHCFGTKTLHERTRTDGRTSFHCFVNKGRCASADWRSELQACVWKTAEDFLDTEFQHMSDNENSPVNN